MAGMRCWQSVRLIENASGDLIPDAPAVNGLYAVRLNSVQAYVGMSVDLKTRLAKNLRRAPRMIGTLPSGSVRALPIPRIYNLARLEKIYIQQTIPRLKHIWNDLRFHVLPATQSCMTPENRRYLIETIRNRHNVLRTDATSADAQRSCDTFK